MGSSQKLTTSGPFSA